MHWRYPWEDGYYNGCYVTEEQYENAGVDRIGNRCSIIDISCDAS